ncbi:MAG: FHA domain-containing protein [Iamia sp.]
MSDPTDSTRHDRIVISSDDLGPDEPAPPPVANAGSPNGAASGTAALPPIQPAGAALTVSTPSASGVLTKLSANSIVSGLVAGSVGGAIGFLLAENLKNPSNNIAVEQAAARIESGVFVGIFGLVLGLVILAWDGITTGAVQKAIREGAIGGAIGGVAGFIGGWLAQYLFNQLLDDLDLAASQSDVEMKLRIARTVAWGVFGGLTGVGLGLRNGKRKAVNGLIGGVLGGGLAGLVFEQIELSTLDDGGDFSGFWVRAIGIGITGVGIGLGVGLVDRLRRDAWLMISGGPMAGKEFILFKDSTTVGSDYRNDIVLVKDRAVAPQHLSFDKGPRGASRLHAAPGAPVLVNGTPAHDHQLRPGDVIIVGVSTITYQERAASPV